MMQTGHLAMLPNNTTFDTQIFVYLPAGNWSIHKHMVTILLAVVRTLQYVTCDTQCKLRLLQTIQELCELAN